MRMIQLTKPNWLHPTDTAKDVIVHVNPDQIVYMYPDEFDPDAETASVKFTQIFMVGYNIRAREDLQTIGRLIEQAAFSHEISMANARDVAPRLQP